MNQNHIDPLTYDPAGVMIDGTGLSPDDLTWFGPRLENARKEVLADLDLWHSGGPVPTAKNPLDAGFIDLP